MTVQLHGHSEWEPERRQTLLSSMLSLGIPEWALLTYFLIIIMYLSGTGQDSECTVIKSQRLLLLLWWA